MTQSQPDRIDRNGIRADFKLRLDSFALDAAFAAPSAGVTALFGPSGSGKTTVLRCIAGLERAAGSLHVDGEAWQDGARFVATHKRPLGYVFQEVVSPCRIRLAKICTGNVDPSRCKAV